MAIINENDDDASANTGTQYTLPFGDTFQGTLDSDTDQDWIRLELTAGTIYNISLDTAMGITEEGVLLVPFELMDNEGNPISFTRQFPHFGPLIFEPTISGTYYLDVSDRWSEMYPLDYEITLSENTIPVGTYDELADYLAYGFDEWRGASSNAFDVTPGGTLTANITGLDEMGQQFARWALEVWADVTDIVFRFVDDDNANITFGDDQPGFVISWNGPDSWHINISADAVANNGPGVDSPTMNVYLHEIGHVLGLGHPGPYGTGEGPRARFGVDNIFLIDSTQATTMSYFGVSSNTYIRASQTLSVTPMIADIIAIQKLYGATDDVRTGDTIYGYQSNVDGYLGEVLALLTGYNNPFFSISLDSHFSIPVPADLDGDGDLDLIIGTGGSFHYYENYGTIARPEFTPRTGAANPLADLVAGYLRVPALADLDADGDLDLAVRSIQNIYYYENTGTSTVPEFTSRTGAANPLDNIDIVDYEHSPAFADLDGDGDLDLVIGSADGIHYYENTGTVAQPEFTPRTGAANPLADINAGYVSAPALADLDADGDLDLAVGTSAGYGRIVHYYENTGTITEPLFTPRTGAANPLRSVPMVGAGTPTFADLDGDGDQDLVYGNVWGDVYYAENIGTSTRPDFVARSVATDESVALTLYDNGGTDTLDLSTDFHDQQVDLRPEGISDVYGFVGNLIIARDTIIENFIAGSGSDTVIGNAVANRLEGRTGDDTLYGGSGADTLNGGNDDDHLHGGGGADILNGGPGDDTAYYTNSSVGVLVRLHEARAVRFGEAEGDTLTGIEHLVGSDYNDTLAGDGEDNILEGRNGDDVLFGGPAGGDDMMYGGNGDDRIFGGRGNDTLTGGEGNDVLKGGPGEDVFIVDGDDMDVLYGGPDKDTFRFFPSDLGGGSIRDFSDGEDVIDLTAFTGISSMDDLDIISHGDNVQIEVSGTDYLTIIILSDFDVSNLDNSDFLF